MSAPLLATKLYIPPPRAQRVVRPPPNKRRAFIETAKILPRVKIRRRIFLDIQGQAKLK
jgi:hypothetical protein